MLDRLQQFFQQHLLQPEAGDNTQHRLQLASAALMVEIIHADESISPEEESKLQALLQQRFELNDAEMAQLLELAHEEKHQATDYYGFTSLINEHYSPAQKKQLVEDMWRLAYADGELDKFEEHLIRRLADLLYVPHKDFMQAKHKAMAL